MMQNPYMFDDAKSKLMETRALVEAQAIDIKNLLRMLEKKDEEIEQIRKSQRTEVELRGELNMQRF